MATVVEELVAVLGLDVDESTFKKGESSLTNIASLWTKIAGIGIAAGSVLSGAINQSTAKIENMAAALGVSGDFLEAFGNTVKDLGFDFENVADLIEEMNNKLGESKGLKEITPVTEALKILNIKFSELQKLAPEEQFKAIANAALKLKDQQKAVSAVDILMGGEANKIFGFMRRTGESFDTLIKKQMDMNFQTKESRQGAKLMTASLGRVMTLVTSFAKLIAGLAGRFLAPLIDKIVVWATVLVNVTKTGINEFIEKTIIAMKILGSTIGVFLAYGLLTNLGSIVAVFIKLKNAILAVQFSIFLIPILIGLVSIAFVALGQDILLYFASGGKADTAFGRLIGWLRKVSPLANAIINRFTAIGESFNKWRLNRISMVTDRLEAVGKMIDSLIEKWQEFKTFFSFDVLRDIGANFNVSAVTAQPQSIVSINDLPPIPNTSGTSTTTVTNNISIDASGMDKDQLNQAIDERTGQNNAIAVNNNSTGVLF